MMVCIMFYCPFIEFIEECFKTCFNFYFEGNDSVPIDESLFEDMDDLDIDDEDESDDEED